MSTSYLPFLRGKTASCGLSLITETGSASVLPSTTGDVTEATPYRKDLAGKIFETTDDPMGNTSLADGAAATGTTSGSFLTAGTGLPLKLRCVQANADIVIDSIGQMVSFDSTAGQFGVVATETAVDGGLGKPIDGAYKVGTTISKYDYFYVIEEGPAIVVPADGESLAAHGPVSISASAGTVGPAVAGDAVIGTSDAAVTGAIDGTTTATVAKIYVTGGLVPSEAAG